MSVYSSFLNSFDLCEYSRTFLNIHFLSIPEISKEINSTQEQFGITSPLPVLKMKEISVDVRQKVTDF